MEKLLECIFQLDMAGECHPQCTALGSFSECPDYTAEDSESITDTAPREQNENNTD